MVLEKLPKNMKFLQIICYRIENKSDKIKKCFIKNNKTNEEKEIRTDILIIATGYTYTRFTCTKNWL